MSVEDHDNDSKKERPAQDSSSGEGTPPSPGGRKAIRDALRSETDEPLPPLAEAIAERDAKRKHPITPQGRRRRFLNRRNITIAAIAAAVGVVALLLLIVGLYRLGFVDRYVAGQIKDTFAKYGIRAEIRDFHAGFPPQTVEISGVELFDAQSGERLGKIDRLLATVRIEDLYALNLQRNINLKDLKIEGLEAWVMFDEQGRSNFRNIHIPPPEPNKRILFAYSTAHIEIKNGVIHYGDTRHEISGEGRNLNATIQPDDPSAPAESWMNTVTLALSNSTFVYDGRPINNIEVEARGRVNQTRAEIQELVLRSPVAEAHLQGTMDDWRALHYQMNITSSVDLTQLSDVLQASTTLRGTGKFAGVVSGEGDKYKVEGSINSDALAADNLRLQGLSVTGSGSGQGRTYDINGKAVAALLSAGDFQLNNVQLVGGVMGTGSDFRWIGELRAAAERSYGTTIAGLILQDARAEMNNGVLTVSSAKFTANSLSGSSGMRANGVTASNLRFRNENNVTTGSVASAKAGTITASGAKIDGVTANNIDVVSRDGVTSVVVKDVQVGATSGAGAEIGSLNIAGVRLSLRDGRMQGSTADIDAGTVKLADGQVENVKLTKPVFVVEPSGSYRASADLSLGGGVLGQMNMGQARAQLVATSSEIQLNNFSAEIFEGRANGNARIAIGRGGSSRIAATFDQVEVAGPLTAFAGAAVPLSGRATGRIDLAFPGTDFKQASGTISSTFTAENPEGGRVPLSGVVELRADHGLFNIGQLDLQTTATKLKATGQFSFSGDSNLQVDLNSSDAAELQTVLISSGLLPDIEEQMRTYGLELAGQLAFNGTLRGKLSSPDVDGRVSLGTLLVNGTDLGSLTASIKTTATEMQIADGRLTERDGGGMQFTLFAPRAGKDNTTFEATLDRVNAGNLIAALPLSKTTRAKLADTQADASGQIKIAGIPNAMSGSGELRFGPGRLAGEQLESMIARATFAGSKVSIETVDARLAAGHIVGSGSYDTTTRAFDVQGRAEGVQLSRLLALASQPGLSNISGTADFNAHIVGNLSESDFSAYQITFDGQGRDVVINGRSAGTLALAGQTENKQLNITLTTGVFGSNPQVIAAQVNLGTEKLAATVETTLNNADLTGLLKMLLPQATVNISGLATGTLKASGNLLDEDGYFSAGGLRGTANFTSLSFRVEDVQLNATSPLVVQFSPSEITFEQTRFTGPGTNIVLGGTLALGPDGRESMTADGQLNLRVLNGLSPDAFLSGIAEVAVRVTGTYERPRLNGTASVASGSFSLLLGNERWTIANVKTLVRFTANQAQIDSMTGTLGGGHISATGGALLEGFTLARFLFNVHGDNVTAPYPTNFRTTADLDLEIKGTSREQLISGVVNVKRSEYTEDIELADLINFKQVESIEEGNEIEITRTALFSDLRVEGRNALVVRNNLADMVGSISLLVNGPVKDPLLSGRITATSGTLNFRNDRYEITRALVDLPPQRQADPIINVQGESQIRGYRVTVGLTGPLSQPQAVISSEPALPQADVVSLITTGQLASGDTSTSILSQSGLGTATSLLTDALINAPAQRATSKLFGLSRFEINPVIGGTGSTPAARLTVGKRINKDLSVTYSTNVTSDPNQILAVEYRVSDRLFFIAQYEQASTRRLTTRNNNFNFEIRFRRRF